LKTLNWQHLQLENSLVSNLKLIKEIHKNEFTSENGSALVGVPVGAVGAVVVVVLPEVVEVVVVVPVVAGTTGGIGKPGGTKVFTIDGAVCLKVSIPK